MKSTQSWLNRHITIHDDADPKSERENALTHAAGTAAALVFLIWVLVKKHDFAHHRTWVGMLVYGATLVLLYLSSTLYHHVPKGDLKRLFRVFDHANIYLLIAGTYTPILAYIGSPAATRLSVITWGVALCGIIFSLLFWGRLKALHVLFYLGMGWMIVFFWNDIVPFIPSGLLGWILGAGLTYTVGVFFYTMKRIPHNHMIWHLFCVVASSLFCIGFFIHLTS